MRAASATWSAKSSASRCASAAEGLDDGQDRSSLAQHRSASRTSGGRCAAR